MILYRAVILVLFLKLNEGQPHLAPNSEEKHGNPNTAPRSFDAAELARLIHKVIEGDDIKGDNQEKSLDPSGIDLDYFAIRNEQQPALLAQVMQLMQRNYDAAGSQDLGIRVHVINNPEVLEQYQKSLRGQELSTSSSEGDDSSDYELRLKRRHAASGIAKSSGDNIRHNYLQDDIRKAKHQQEDNVKVIHSNSNPIIDSHDSNKPNRKNDRYNDETTTDVWDVITKKYDWGDEPKNDDIDKKNDDNFDKGRSARYKGKLQKKFKRVTRQDDWDKPLGTKDDDSFDKVKHLQKKFKKVTRQEGWDNPKKASKDSWGDELRDNDRDKSASRKIKRDKYDWDKPMKAKKSSRTSYEKQDNWNVKKNKDNFKDERQDSWKSKNKKDDFKDERQDSWKSKNKKDDFKEDNWKAKDDFKMTTYKTTKNWKRESNNDWTKQHPSKSNDYYKPRPRNHANAERAGLKAFGRTSIPFVGKKGIYDDK